MDDRRRAIEELSRQSRERATALDAAKIALGRSALEAEAPPAGLDDEWAEYRARRADLAVASARRTELAGEFESHQAARRRAAAARRTLVALKAAIAAADRELGAAVLACPDLADHPAFAGPRAKHGRSADRLAAIEARLAALAAQEPPSAWKAFGVALRRAAARAERAQDRSEARRAAREAGAAFFTGGGTAPAGDAALAAALAERRRLEAEQAAAAAEAAQAGELGRDLTRRWRAAGSAAPRSELARLAAQVERWTHAADGAARAAGDRLLSAGPSGPLAAALAACRAEAGWEERVAAARAEEKALADLIRRSARMDAELHADKLGGELRGLRRAADEQRRRVERGQAALAALTARIGAREAELERWEQLRRPQD